jgi:hypothetical protein
VIAVAWGAHKERVAAVQNVRSHSDRGKLLPMRHLLWIAAVVVLVVAMSGSSVPGWLLGVVVVATIAFEYAILWALGAAFMASTLRWVRTQKR